MVEIIARTQIQVGKNRYIARGERASVEPKIAEMFVGRGKADYYYPPLPRYETKVLFPQVEVVAPPTPTQPIPPLVERSHRPGGRR